LGEALTSTRSLSAETDLQRHQDGRFAAAILAHEEVDVLPKLHLELSVAHEIFQVDFFDTTGSDFFR
jgi:hypothetical protein